MGFRSGCLYVVARIYVEGFFIFSSSMAYRPGQGGKWISSVSTMRDSIQKTKIDLGLQHAQCSCGLR